MYVMITVITRRFIDDTWRVFIMIFQFEQWLDLACLPNDEAFKFTTNVWVWFTNKLPDVELILEAKR